jgi:protein-S-isoprenylcysteine O-methyltransferase Ste14
VGALDWRGGGICVSDRSTGRDGARAAPAFGANNRPGAQGSAAAYLLISILFFGPCFLLWRPLPLALTAPARIVALALGTLLLFPGLILYLWARLTLGEMYNVSSSMGAQLYADHRLVTHRPFALVRHPMYVGILLASAGGLLIYRTWTLVFTTVTFLGLVLRARREEQALAAEFGQRWQEYCQRVPGWIPHILRKHS